MTVPWMMAIFVKTQVLQKYGQFYIENDYLQL